MSETHSVPQLLALLEAAVPAPWRARRCFDGSPDWLIENDYRDDGGQPAHDAVGTARPGDAALIVALRNEAPALLRELVDLRADLARKEKALGEAEAQAAMLRLASIPLPEAGPPCPERQDNYGCTLVLGHDGAHVAHGSDGAVITAWLSAALAPAEGKEGE